MGLVSNIKADAQGNRTKIQSSDAAALEQIFNKMFYLDKNPEKETAFVGHVMTRGLETAERTGLHASALIVSDPIDTVTSSTVPFTTRQCAVGGAVPAPMPRASGSMIADRKSVV